MANTNSPLSYSAKERTKYSSLEVEIPLGLLEHLPELEMTPSPVALDKKYDNFLGLCYRVDVELLKNFARCQLGEVKTAVYENFFPTIFFITGYGKLTSRVKRVWLGQFDCWSPSQIPV